MILLSNPLLPQLENFCGSLWTLQTARIGFVDFARHPVDRFLQGFDRPAFVVVDDAVELIREA